MSSTKELRNQIRSIKSTQKITSAMEMVAASKMRKAQDRMQAARPYADRIQCVIEHVASAHPEYRHPFLEQRTAKRVGIIVVTSDRGLCGGLNVNLLKTMLATVKQWQDQNVQSEFCVIGNKGEAFFRRHGGNLLASAVQLGDAPQLTDIVGVIRVMLDAYYEQKIDRLFVVYNQFVSTMVQRPWVQQLLPLVPPEKEVEKGEVGAGYWDYIYEPDARALLDLIMNRYIESQVYRGVVENIACFQAAQMVAMKSATDNAGQLIDELQLIYNKARQAGITQELAEIVSGAAAV
ncbi:MAG: F0F1 ATP synthase subunit gamma [Gammaproteobacteria bacterium]|nr:F0F1 ATP synthase subunit gamma [Gammaproteobacteria bacterium]